MSENTFFWLSLFAWLFLSGVATLYFKKFPVHFVKIMGMNLVIFLVFSFIWFFEIAINDGISQVMGVFFYLGYGVVLCIVQIVILKVVKSKK